MALRVFLIALAGIWAAIVFFWPVGFWYTGDEYAFLALSHAINLEATLREGTRFANAGLGNHPGVPMYLLSWLCLHVSALGSGQRDLIGWALANPEPFYLVTRVAAGLVVMASVCFAYSVLAPLAPWKRVLAISTFFAADPWSLFYGLTSLGNETFALALVALLFWLVKKYQDRATFWMLAGAVAAAAYLVKLPYLSIAVGVGAMALFCPPHQWSSMIKRGAISGAAFVLLVSITLLIVAGWSESLGLLTSHLTFFTRPSTGFRNPYSEISWPMFLSAVAAAGAIFHQMVTPRSRSVWNLVALCAFTAATLALLSHFGSRYTLIVSAFFPFIWRGPLEKRWAAFVCLAVTGLSAIMTLMMARSDLSESLTTADAMRSDEAIIAQLPLKPGEAILWTYAIQDEKFAKEFVLQMGGVQKYARAKLAPSNEFSSYQIVDRPYRYVILEKARHPQITSFQEPNGLPVRLDSAISITPLQRTIVVEIATNP